MEIAGVFDSKTVIALENVRIVVSQIKALSIVRPRGNKLTGCIENVSIAKDASVFETPPSSP